MSRQRSQQHTAVVGGWRLAGPRDGSSTKNFHGIFCCLRSVNDGVSFVVSVFQRLGGGRGASGHGVEFSHGSHVREALANIIVSL